jgi:predicted SAM-dependent methyltransferase
MLKIACVMMQKDERFLLRPWLAYHGYLFGFENLFVFDNGSTRPEVRATLMEYALKGVRVDWDHPTREDYLAKGELIGARIQALDATGQYQFLLPLDCDEFVLLRTEADFVCAREPILTWFAGLIGETRILRVPYQLANHPLNADIYHYFPFFKVFFPAGTVSPIDHGHHVATDRLGREPKDTLLVHLHFHHKMFNLKLEQARLGWIGLVDVDDRAGLETYDGKSAHLKQIFLQSAEQYYRGFLDMPHFYLPRFRALLNDLGAPLELPTETVPDDLQLHIAEADDASQTEENGAVVIVPMAAPSPVVSRPYRTIRFHEGQYLQANPGVAEAGVDPTIHFCLHGFREGRPLRPVAAAASRDTPSVRAAIAAYAARERGSARLELGSGGGPRPSGWLATDLEPTEHALKLDVTHTFPIDDATFDHVYARNLIEHLDFAAGRFMLGECLRILRPGGTIRIATRSIEFLLGLFSPERSEAKDRYIQWVTETFAPAAPKPMASFVFDHLVRGQGRRFIYDRPTLEMALTEAGFADVQACESERGELPLSREDQLPPESLILEATRPFPRGPAPS